MSPDDGLRSPNGASEREVLIHELEQEQPLEPEQVRALTLEEITPPGAGSAAQIDPLRRRLTIEDGELAVEVAPAKTPPPILLREEAPPNGLRELPQMAPSAPPNYPVLMQPPRLSDAHETLLDAVRTVLGQGGSRQKWAATCTGIGRKFLTWLDGAQLTLESAPADATVKFLDALALGRERIRPLYKSQLKAWLNAARISNPTLRSAVMPDGDHPPSRAATGTPAPAARDAAWLCPRRGRAARTGACAPTASTAPAAWTCGPDREAHHGRWASRRWLHHDLEAQQQRDKRDPRRPSHVPGQVPAFGHRQRRER